MLVTIPDEVLTVAHISEPEPKQELLTLAQFHEDLRTLRKMGRF